MAMWATPDDVLERWIGDDAPADAAKLQRWVDDAERLVLVEFPDIAGRISADPSVEDAVRYVVAHMVIRAWRNPSGLRQFNEQTGPLGFSGTFVGKHPGGLELTDDERAMLGGSRHGRPRAFSISTIRPRPSGPWGEP